MSKLTYAVIFILLCAFTISTARDYLCDDLRNSDNQYDYIVISGSQDAVYNRVKPLMDWRYEEGFSPLFVDIHDIYVEFGSSGNYTYALKVFIDWVQSNWTIVPEYIFLIGHGWLDEGHTYDDFFVPTYKDEYDAIDTWFIVDASDEPFAQIGRLNVEEDMPENVDYYCEKVEQYESTLYEDYTFTPVLVSSNDDGGGQYGQNYTSAIHTSDFLDGFSVLHDEYHESNFGSPTDWRDAIISSINSDQSLFVYFSEGQRGIVDGHPITELSNDRYYTSFISACSVSNIEFMEGGPTRSHHMGDVSTSLGLQQKGAVGFICPDGNNYTNYSRPLLEDLLTQIFTKTGFNQRDNQNRLGDIFIDVLNQATNYRYQDYRKYNVIGDPALLVNIPVMPSDGYISEDTVWSGNVSLTHDVLIPRGRTLTLLPGTTLEAAQVDAYEYGYLDGQVGDARVELIVEGELVIEGTKDNPVMLSGDGVNDWGGILVRNAGEVNGSHLLISDAKWGIHLQGGGEAHLTDSLITDCESGVYAHGRRVNFSDLNIENCGTGVFVSNGEDLEQNELYKTQARMRDCYIANNERGINISKGLSFDAGTESEPGNNVISGNTLRDIEVNPSSGLSELSFVGNAWGTFYASRVDEIFNDVNVDGLKYFPFQVAGVLGEDETIPPPPIMGGSVALDGDLVVPDGITLTIPAGCTLEAANTDIAHSGSDSLKAELIVGSGGSLLSEGTVQNPILLTSSNDNPGSWYGVRFEEGANGSLQHTVIEKAIYGVESSSSPVLDHVELRECSLAGYRSLGGSGELTDCFIHDNDNPESVIEGDDYGHGVIATMGSEVRLRNCEITDNAGDGVRVLGGSPDLGSYESLGRNQFDNNEGLDINCEAGVVPGGSLIARGNEFGTIDGLELDQRVSDSVELSPVVFGGTVDHGSDLPYFEPDEEQLPVCYVDRDVYLVNDLTIEPFVSSPEFGGEPTVEYFEFRIASGTKFLFAPLEETPFFTPDDPCLVDIEITDIPFIVEPCPEGEVAITTFELASFGEFSPLKETTFGGIKHMFGPDKGGLGLDTEHYLELNDVVISSCLGVIVNLPSSVQAHLNNVTVQDGASGIEIISGDVLFRECTIRNNDSFGLSLNGGAKAKLYRCEVSGNDGDGIYLETGAEIDLGVPVGGDEPMIGLNYFADNTGFDLNNNSGTVVAAHGNQWSESDWDTILRDAIHNPGGEDYSHLFPVAWSGVLKSGDALGKCNWLGNMLLLGDVTVPVGMLAGQPFVLNFETPLGAEGVEIAELPGLDRTHGGEHPNKSEFRINGEVISEDPIHLTRLSLPTVMDGEFPPPEIGEWTGLIVSSQDQLTLNEYNVRWAETGIRVIGADLDELTNCEVTDSLTAISCEDGANPTLFGNELHAELEGLVCSDRAWPVLLDEPNSNSFYMDFNLTTLPSHFYIANRNAAIFPGDPTTIDATLCKWYNAAGENQEPEDWMFDGDVTYESSTMLAENRSQIITEEDDKTELEEGHNEIDLANDEDTTAIEIDSNNDSIIGVIEDESVRLDADNSSTLAHDSLEATTLTVDSLNTTSSIEEPSQLLSVVPNPTTGMITITVELSNSQRVELSLYDLAGRLVETIHRGSLSEGRHSLSYDTSGIIGGLYLLHLSTDEATETTRLAIVR